MSIAAYQGVCPTCRYDHSADTLASTTRETADHIGEANEKVVQTPMHRDAAKAALALKVSGRADHIGDATTMIYHAELLAKLRQVDSFNKHGHPGAICTNWHRNPEGPEAANIIEALLSEIAALRGDLTETRVAADLLVSSLRADLRQAERQRDEAVELLRRYRSDLPTEALEDLADAFIANQGADQ